MQEGLVTTYRRQLQGRIVSNAAVLALTPFRSPIPGRPVVLGHLSNLCVEKGIREVVESFLRLHRAGLDVNFHLAGGFADAEAEVLVGRARKVLGDRLVLWGPISGECKDAFYQNLDIFLFPTRFTLEAQPNVVFEAMQGSNAVIAFARGCIPSMLARGGGRVVPRDGDFAGVVEHLVAAWITERDTLEAVRRAAWESAMVQRAEALEAFDALIRHLNQEEVTQASLSPLASPVSPADHRTEQLP
jgi:glycosyltransferase involved in cell wall biosynthesis